ncbi:MAG: c-type cytochrome [Flavobacteriales bacterium]|nr:c-type cytochrome [Bacteroidota bacterium]MCB9240447.1 c-type cytochrome [Flavobacteriales bacterium]
MKTNKSILKKFLTVVLLLGATQVMGQDAAQATPGFQITLSTLIYVFASILLVIAIAIWRIANHLKKYIRNEFASEEEQSRSSWERIFQLKSLKSDKDTVIDHPHDGIYELDNPPPPWFMWLFYLTVLFAVVYYVRFTFTDYGYTQADEYNKEVELAMADQESRLEKEGNAIDENTVTLLTDEVSLAKGKSIFDGNCAICHGNYGQGATGPNFTDNYFLHGGSIKDLYKTIKYGVVEKGMISWQSQLSPQAIQLVASYVKSFQGTTPPVPGKDPQGELYVEGDDASGDAAAPSDSTANQTDSTANDAGAQ